MKVLLLVLITLLAGCVTPYGPAGYNGGYSESMRSVNIYVVRFEGNAYTKPAEAEEMALLRAAELTLAKGGSFFTILNESSSTATSSVYVPGQTTTTARIGAGGVIRAQSSTTPGISVPMSSPTARFVIAMASTNTVPGHVWLDASKVAAELRPKYKK